LDDEMMEDFLGADYTMNEIREANGVQNCGEETPVVYLCWIVKCSRK
jgi:hypothetical protein